MESSSFCKDVVNEFTIDEVNELGTLRVISGLTVVLVVVVEVVGKGVVVVGVTTKMGLSAVVEAVLVVEGGDVVGEMIKIGLVVVVVVVVVALVVVEEVVEGVVLLVVEVVVVGVDVELAKLLDELTLFVASACAVSGGNVGKSI